MLKARLAVPIHYRYTAGPIRDRLLLKYDGTPERFAETLSRAAPAVQAKILEPGEPLIVDAQQRPAPELQAGAADGAALGPLLNRFQQDMP